MCPGGSWLCVLLLRAIGVCSRRSTTSFLLAGSFDLEDDFGREGRWMDVWMYRADAIGRDLDFEIRHYSGASVLT